MNKLIEFFARQGIFADIVTVATIGMGFLSASLIQREIFPNVQLGFVTITTIYPGASPAESEKLITNPLEQDLKEVDGIKKLFSTSAEGRSYIVAQIDEDQTTQEEAKNDINDVVDQFKDLPDGAEDPVVIAIETKQQPIVEVHLFGNVDPMVLREEARKLENKIESLRGVAKVVNKGIRDLEIRVEADPSILENYSLSLDDIMVALRAQNNNVPGGVIETIPSSTESVEKLIRTIGEFTDLESVKETVIRANDLGQPLKVSDVANVFYELKRESLRNRTDGKASIQLTILKKESADAISTVDNLLDHMTEWKKTIEEKGLSISYINDFSYFIRRRLKILISNLGIGLILVFIVLSLILPFKVALIAAVGIPFAFLGALIFFFIDGISINLLTLMGFIIVVGMLVDDAIVVTDNAVRYIEEGMDPKEAAIKGTQQIWGPVTASVLTTIIAFLPLMFMSGMMGKFVKFLPIGVIAGLIISLFECFFILPHHIARWIKHDKREINQQKSALGRFLAKTEYFWDHVVTPKYVEILRKTVRKRYLILSGLTGLFVVSIAIAVLFMNKTLFPSDGIETFFVRAETKVGTSIDQMTELMKPIEKEIGRLPKHELKNYVTNIGIQQQDPNDPNTKRGSNFAQISIYLTPEPDRDRTAIEIIEDLRKKIGKPKGLRRVTFDRINPGPPQGKAINIGVRGKEFADILPAVESLKKIIEKQEGASDIMDSYFDGKEEFQIHLNRAEMSAAGLNVLSVGQAVRAAFEGVIATSVRRVDEEVKIRVTYPKSERTKEKTIKRITIRNPQGNLVPLTRIAKIKKDRSVAAYSHEANARQVNVTGLIDDKLTSTLKINNAIRKLIPTLQKKHPDVSFHFAGGDEDTRESLQNLAISFAVALVGILLILIMNFKTISQPLLILLTVPLGIIAVIWTLFLHNMPLSFFAMMGTIALSGVIVNNAIVLVDFVNQLRAEGKDRWESIFEAGRMRIRPIFLTTITTVFGILPTAYGIGGLDKFVVPIAMALGWGIFFGSVLAAFAFPSAIAILDDINEKLSELYQKYFKQKTG